VGPTNCPEKGESLAGALRKIEGRAGLLGYLGRKRQIMGGGVGGGGGGGGLGVGGGGGGLWVVGGVFVGGGVVWL